MRPPRAWIAKAPLAAVLAAAFALVPIGSSRAAGATSRSAKASGCDPSLVPADAPNLQTKMGSCPDGTTFSFAGGLYRITAQLPLGQGDSVVGAGSGTGGTEFRGSIVLPASSFAQSGALWVHTGDAQSVGIMGDPCEPGVQGCGYLDWVYRDGTFLSRVLSPCTSLGPDQFCIAYGANKIYLGQAPGSHLIEYSTVSGMLISGVRAGDVTVRGLSYDEFASGGGPIAASAGWVVDGVRGHHNHGCGIAALQAPASSPATIQNSQFDHNGYHGICDYPVGTQILDDDIGFNNAIGFAHGTGIKVHGSNGLIQGNTIHDNDGPGVSLGQLADGTGADGERIQSNTITTNAGEGVQLTHACNILVDGNTITGNQLFAIDIQDSNTDSISNNIVSVPASSTYGGIRIMATKATAPNYDCGIWNDARHNDVLTNTVTMGTMANHGTYGNINGVVQTGGLLGAEVFTGNVYHVPSGGCAINNWYWWDGSVQRKATYPTWVSTYGQDAPPGSCGS